MRNLKALMILMVVCSVTVVRADDEAGKKALTHDDYNKWSRVGGQTLSPNGASVLPVLANRSTAAEYRAIRVAVSELVTSRVI